MGTAFRGGGPCTKRTASNSSSSFRVEQVPTKTKNSNFLIFKNLELLKAFDNSKNMKTATPPPRRGYPWYG